MFYIYSAFDNNSAFDNALQSLLKPCRILPKTPDRLLTKSKARFSQGKVLSKSTTIFNLHIFYHILFVFSTIMYNKGIKAGAEVNGFFYPLFIIKIKYFSVFAPAVIPAVSSNAFIIYPQKSGFSDFITKTKSPFP